MHSVMGVHICVIVLAYLCIMYREPCIVYLVSCIVYRVIYRVSCIV